MSRRWTAGPSSLARFRGIEQQHVSDAASQSRPSAEQNDHRPSERPLWHDVQVHWPDGSTHLDGIRGHDREHALDNAQWNWISGNPYGRADRIEYLGVSDDQSDPADGYTAPDWWGDDYPQHTDNEDVR